MAACPYNAIVEIERPCKKSCPVKAISMDENDIATIDPKKCINCGACVVGCPFGAISDVSMMTSVIDALRSDGQEVVAMVAPAIEGQFGKATLPQIKEAIRQLGFKDVYEVALGADMVALSEAEELARAQGGGPAHDLLLLSRVRQPGAQAFSRPAALRVHHRVPHGGRRTVYPRKRPEAVTVFIGPCIAKKNEVMSQYIQELEYVLTFEELYAMLCAKGIEAEAIAVPGYRRRRHRYRKGFAALAGVTAAVQRGDRGEGGPTSPSRWPNAAARMSAARP